MKNVFTRTEEIESIFASGAVEAQHFVYQANRKNRYDNMSIKGLLNELKGIRTFSGKISRLINDYALLRGTIKEPNYEKCVACARVLNGFLTKRIKEKTGWESDIFLNKIIGLANSEDAPKPLDLEDSFGGLELDPGVRSLLMQEIRENDKAYRIAKTNGNLLEDDFLVADEFNSLRVDEQGNWI